MLRARVAGLVPEGGERLLAPLDIRAGLVYPVAVGLLSLASVLEGLPELCYLSLLRLVHFGEGRALCLQRREAVCLSRKLGLYEFQL